MPKDLRKLYRDLKSDLVRIEKVHIRRFLKKPLATPSEYELSVKAYLLLCHAAFEEFMEEIATELLTSIEVNYIKHQKYSKALACLLHFRSSNASELQNEKFKDDPFLVFTHIRTSLDSIKASFANDIYNNNGAGIKYINRIMVPLGVQVTTDAGLLDSLKKLAKERGHYAHKRKSGGAIRHSLSPEDAKRVVSDCIKVFKDIRDKAIKLI